MSLRIQRADNQQTDRVKTIKQLTSSICWTFSFCRRAQRYCYVYSLRWNQDPVPRLHCGCFFLFWPHCTTCRILVSQPGIEPRPWAVKAGSCNHLNSPGILHYCFLTAPLLSLHPHPSLISSCLNLPFGTE